MKSFSIFISLIVLTTGLIKAQVNKYGYPIYTHYDEEMVHSNAQNWDLVRSATGLIYVANNLNGVLVFDGENWSNIEIPGDPLVRSITIDKNNIIYIGGLSTMGCLLPNKSGNLEYKSFTNHLPDSLKSFDIYNLFTRDDSIYFSANNFKLYKYIFPDDSLQIIDLPEHTFKAFLLNDNIYCGSYATGIYKINNNGNVLIKGGDKYSLKNVFSLLNDGKQNFVITGRSGIDIYNFNSGINKSFLTNNARDYLKSVFTYSAALKDKDLVLGTIGKGMIIIDENGELSSVYNSQIGIKDGYSIAVKPYNNVIWTTLSLGVSAIEYSHPFRIFSGESGLQGFINILYKFNNTLFVGTDVGLFYLHFDSVGMPVFSRVEGIDDQVFSISKITDQKTKKEVLLAGGTTTGLYELDFVHKKASRIEAKLKGIHHLFSSVDQQKLKNVKLKVYKSLATNSGKYWGSDPKQVFSIELNKGVWSVQPNIFKTKEVLNSLVSDNTGTIWGASDASGVMRFNNLNHGISYYHDDKGLPGNEIIRIVNYNQQIVAIAPSGVYRYKPITDKFERWHLFDTYLNNSKRITRLLNMNDQSALVNFEENGHFKMDMLTRKDTQLLSKKNYFDRIKDLEVEYFMEDTMQHLIWLTSADKLYSYNLNTDYHPDTNFYCYVRKVEGKDSIYFNGYFYGKSVPHLDGYYPSKQQTSNQTPIIDHKSNDLTFHFASPYFEGNDLITYSYFLKGYNKNWSKWNAEAKAVFTNLNEGDYIFRVKAKNVYGNESSIGSYAFSILPPWYRTILAYVVYVIMALGAVVIIVKLYTRRLQQEKIRLEGIVRERTAEIREQRDQIAEQKQSIEDSILYASRIQRAILPSNELAEEILPEHFILFRPRDIVSGDYYWMNKIGNKTIVVAADCTGHGVPGAFMSMLGVSFLNEIVLKEQVLEPHLILNKLRQRVKRTLKQEGKEGEAKDGMDVALVVIDEDTHKLYFSGAYNPVYIYRGTELFEIKADRMPIGIYIREKESFTLNEFDYQKGDTFYIFSDGYADQFGGEKGQKFRSKAMKALMSKIQDKSMQEQHDILNQTIEDWMGQYPGQEQIDDMVLLGIRMS